MATSEADNPYDAVPYDSYPYPQTHPQRLAVTATLLGLRPPAVGRARVLELGCCSGGNLLPMAEQVPEAQFLGVDASGNQVAEGAAAISELQLRNVELRHLDIQDVGPDLGQFDYVLAHGVYSWVPPAIQDKILDVCRHNLAPNGVAYVSYNTHPGWRMRGIIRDIMSFRARGFTAPADRLRHARALIDVLAKSVSGEDDAYGIMLRKELKMLEGKDDSYLIHEHLEEHNEPLYFHEFVGRAAAKGLQYLGEADFGSMSLRNLPEQAAAVIDGVAADVVEREQYADFVRNRMFRQTLLVHADAKVDRKVVADRLMGMYVSSAARPEQAVADLRNGERVVFRGSRATTATTDPLVKAALLHLGKSWPRSVPFAELVAVARSRVGGEGTTAVVDTSSAGGDARRLGDTLLRCYETNQVDLSVLPSPFVTEVTSAPVAFAYARYQAAADGWATDGRHQIVRLNDLNRQVLRLLDGTRDRPQIVDELASMVASGALLLHHEGRPIREKEAARAILPTAIDQALAWLGDHALLKG